jgi:hypothetical protein
VAATARTNHVLQFTRSGGANRALVFTDSVGVTDVANIAEENVAGVDWTLTFADSIGISETVTPVEVEAPTPGDLPAFTQSRINTAMTEVREYRVNGQWLTGASFDFEPNYDTTGTIGAACAMHYLALVAFYYPNATSTSSGALVANQVATSINHFLSNGKEPRLYGMYGWTQPLAAYTLVLGKNTPAVWNQLSTATKTRADWLMRTFAVVGNMMHNAAHYNTDDTSLDILLDREGAFLPNQRGYVGPMGAAHIYFGGAAAVNAILAAFDFDEYIAKFNEYGWTKNRTNWTLNAATRELMEGDRLTYVGDGGSAYSTASGAARPFTLRTKAPNAVTGVLARGGEVTYTPFNLFAAEEGGWAYGLNVRNTSYTMMTASCCPNQFGSLVGAASQYTGQLGMMYEFSDATVGRSSFHYTAAANKISIAHWSTLVALGQWPDTAEGDALHEQCRIANDHHYYEAGVQGWRCADCQNRCNQIRNETIEGSNWRSGYFYGKEIFTVMFRGD